MGLDFFLPAKNGAEEESLGDFVSRRLGRQAYERLIEPLMSGIYAGDGDQLSLQATFPFLRDWEQKYGSLTRGALFLRRKRAGSGAPGNRRSIFLTFEDGLAELVDSLVASLNSVRLRLDTRVEAMDYAHGRFLLSTPAEEAFDAVILAAPAYASAAILRSMDPEMARHLDEIPYVSTATVSLAFREAELDHALEGHGYVIPRRAGREALACTWTSTKFPHRAPEGFALLRVFIGRAGREEQALASEGSLIDVARREIAATMGIEATPHLARVFRWPEAMPQYNVGHLDLLDQIERRRERWPGLYLAGAAYRGIGIPDCIRSGEKAAEEAVMYLEPQA
jgi:oxygen-dependent protoporphyrinogen oxidase